MALDAAKNFAKAALASGITSGATSLTLVTGGGAKFANSTNAVIFNSTDYLDPSDDPAVEVVRIGTISGDTVPVTRAQEGTTGVAHNTAGKTYTLIAGPTAKLITDIQAMDITGNASTATTATNATNCAVVDYSANATSYPVFVNATGGNSPLKTASGGIYFNSQNGALGISGALTANSFIGAADANTLSGTTLHSTVVNSSLTSVGTLGALTVTGNVVAKSGGALTLANGANDNVALPAAGTNYITTGPTATYSISGIAGGADGRIITLTDSSGQIWTVLHNSGSSSAGNKIYTPGGATLTIGAGGWMSLTLQYTTTTGGGVWLIVGASGVLYNGGLVQIAKITTSANQATVDFTSIPAAFTDLEVRIQARSNVSATFEQLYCKVNNDGTAGNYTYSQWLDANGTGATSNNIAANAAGVGLVAISGSTSPTSMATSERLEINNYAGTTFYKRLVSWGAETRASGASQEYIEALEGVWKSTAAITRLTFSVPTSFVNGSVFTLYGIGTQ